MVEDDRQNQPIIEEPKDDISALESLYLQSRNPEGNGATSKSKAARSGKTGRKATLSSTAAETEDGTKAPKNFSLYRILGGDVLQSEWVRRQMGLIVLLVVLAVIYISNRYASQQEMIQIDGLKQTLTDVKYDALTRSSELLEKTRRSQVEDYLKKSKDSLLQTALIPPFVIETEE